MIKFLKRIITCAFLLLVIITGLTTFQGYRMYKDALEKESISFKVESIRDKENYTPIGELPQMYLDAVVAVEDHRFYDHKGIDVIAIGRAIWNDIKARSLVEGGSTITQQLGRNLYFTQEKKFTRKIAEVFMALKLEKNYSKDELLELYVNTIYFGNGYYCVGDAAKGYFNKAPEEMNNYESTLLAGIPNAPSVYSLTNRPELAAQRQEQVLRQMVKRGYLTQQEAGRIL